MTVTRALVGAALASLLLTAIPVHAQEAPAAPAGVTSAEDANSDPTKNWLKICDTLENGNKACIMRQLVFSNGQFLGSFMLRDDPGQNERLLAVAAVPIGVLLPAGMLWQIDNNKPEHLNYILCDPQSCAAQKTINQAFINSLKKGAVLKLIAKNRRNENIEIKINLSGFTAVYDSEEALSFEQFQNNATGANALEQKLQDRAEELAREKNEGSQ